MSKSLGNGIDPLLVIDQYGADALRFTLATGNAPGNDMRFSDEKVKASRNFANKLWNAARFVLMYLGNDYSYPGLPKDLAIEDKWILSKVNTLAKEVTDNLERFELGIAVAKLYDFIWDVFCDWYIEIAKIRLQSGEGSDTAKAVLVYVLTDILKLLHPFMPFITEEIYQAIPHDTESIMISKWPEYDPTLSFADEEAQMEKIMDAIRAIRNRRAEMNIPPSKKSKVYVETAFADVFAVGSEFIKRLAYASDVEIADAFGDLGNTVIVVEHEEEVIRAADYIVDIGPKAGYNGGEVVFSGTLPQLLKSRKSLTADYLTGRRAIAPPATERGWSNSILIEGARENNLRNIDVRIPLGVMTCITGVSGSGKSSLAKGILYPALRRLLFDTGIKPGDFDGIGGDVQLLRSVEMIDQNPIGKSSRSNPVTYIKAYDEIRKLFADQPYAQHTGLGASSFSFNIAGGRCEECQGEGVIKVSMQFMADVELVCEACGGKRFKDEILEVRYRGKSIYDVLEMTVDDAIAFFGEDRKDSTCKRIVERLKPLQDVGLGYIKLGQSSSTLSGGESQRVKLASFLTKDSAQGGVMFIFDEPTTGLHFHDINKLLAAFNALIERGHTIVIVEHNMDVIKCADWVVDLGPEAGTGGGRVVFEGTPRNLEQCPASYTGKYLRLRTKL